MKAECGCDVESHHCIDRCENCSKAMCVDCLNNGGHNIGKCVREEKKELVFQYYQTCDKELFPSDVANALNLDPRLVFELTQELVKEGRLV